MLHLTPLSSWSAVPAAGTYTPESLSTEGFVHCSPDERTALAVANSLPYFQQLKEPVVALVIDETRLRSDIHWEPAAPGPPGVTADTLFPHLYGPIDTGAVTEVRYALRDRHERFIGFRPQPVTAAALGLLPHPEGGWFRQTWASGVSLTPPGYSGDRATATAIYFLLPTGEESVWHAVRSDELWLWHRGGPLELLLGSVGERPDPAPEVLTLGPDIAAGQAPQVLVPAGTWQAARPAGETEALVSCVVSPGFDFADFHAL